MKKLSFVLVVVMGSMLFASCATMNGLKDSKADGVAVTYPVDKDRAWDIAKKVLDWQGAGELEEHREQNYILTSTSMNLISYGSVVGVWFDPIGKESTKVTVLTRRRVAINLAPGMRESRFHDYYGYAVKEVKAGRTLPESSPLLDD
jgi:predicted small secreted protein